MIYAVSGRQLDQFRFQIRLVPIEYVCYGLVYNYSDLCCPFRFPTLFVHRRRFKRFVLARETKKSTRYEGCLTVGHLGDGYI